MQNYFKKIKPQIIEAMTKQINNMQDVPLKNAPSIANDLLEYTCRGKLLRASFVCMAAESFGRSIDDEVLNVAVAIELAQSALLIHDDVMDQDDMRRDAPSLHKVYESQFQNKQIGESVAICVGDTSLLWIFQYIAFSPTLVRLFSQELSRTAIGQAYEISMSSTQYEPAKEEIFTIMQNKTAHYTFYLPFAAGMILAGCEVPSDLERFCDLLGYLFQIKDDELNLLENPTSQKSIGGDIRENKKTLCRWELLQKAPKLKQYFGTDQGISEIQTLYREQVQEIIANYLNTFETEALSLVEKFELNEKYRQYWIDLIAYLSHRTY